MIKYLIKTLHHHNPWELTITSPQLPGIGEVFVDEAGKVWKVCEVMRHLSTLPTTHHTERPRYVVCVSYVGRSVQVYLDGEM